MHSPAKQCPLFACPGRAVLCCVHAGSWKYYRILGANDGSGGTPNSQCELGSCSQSRPRLAVWDDAVVIANEERSLRNPESFYYGSNVYAIDKHALLRAADTATTALVRTGEPGIARPSVSFIVPARQSGACRLRNTPEVRLLGGAQNPLQLFSLTGTATSSYRSRCRPGCVDLGLIAQVLGLRPCFSRVGLLDNLEEQLKKVRVGWLDGTIRCQRGAVGFCC